MGGGAGMFGGGGMQDDEQSDLEFMDSANQQQIAVPLQNDSAVGLFRYILKNNLA
jgi:hypothetical protein